MMRTELAAALGVCLLVGACTSTEVLDIGTGPTPPAPIGETSATAFATEPPAPSPPIAAASPADATQPLPPAGQAPERAPGSNDVPQPQALPPSPAPPEPPRVAAVTPAASALVQVAPIVGATARSVAPLSQRLALRAAERGISLTNNEGGTHVLRGYFSAMQQGGEAVVIYVWDVIDRAGNRVYRMQGQETARMSGRDVWNSIDERTMERIADKTIDDLSAWMGSHRG